MMTPDIMLKYFGQVDLLLAGEVREWECTTYAGDMNSAGEKRSSVTIGRVASEDPGMRVCATWLKTFVKGVPSVDLRRAIRFGGNPNDCARCGGSVPEELRGCLAG